MDMLIDFLFLIVLASMAHQTRKPVLSGVVFGLLKAVSMYLLHVSELGETTGNAITISATHFVLNSLLGFAIAHIVANQSKNPKMVAVMTLLSILSFLTHIASLNVVSLYA